MTKILSFEVSLSNGIAVYSPGEVLQGSLLIQIREDIPLHGIHLWVLGQADVSWADKEGGKRSHFEYEIYMKDCIILWGKDPRHRQPAGKTQFLQAGAHEYSFQYTLPTSLPSSFESEDSQFKGRVHYLLRAKLDSPVDVLRQTKDRVFIVLSTLDLNKHDRLALSVQERKERPTYCCCCRNGLISCILRLERTGFVPGEDVNLDAEIHNQNSGEVTSSYVTMQQIVRYFAQGQSRSNTADIFRISGGQIRPGDSAFYHDIIHIPPLPPSGLDYCRLIHIQYVICVGVIPKGNEDPVEVSVPITVGTIPIKTVIPPNLTLSPSFSRYSHSTGEIEDYVEGDYVRGKYQHVYIYYKSLYKRARSMEFTELS